MSTEIQSSEKGQDTTSHSVDAESGKVPETKNIETDPYLVTFNTPTDPDNPSQWPVAKKWVVTGVLSATGLNRIMVSTIMAPALNDIGSSLHMNQEESVMGMSVYLLATAFGPLVIGPLSEVYGRQPVLQVTNIWFLIWNIICGFANGKGLLIASRLLAGLGASAIYALAGGVLGDIWPPEQRGRSMALYILIPMLGAAVGPIVGGFITEATTWRWIFWSTSILQAAMVAGSFLAFKETYAPIILQRKANVVRRSTGNSQYYTETEKLASGRSSLWLIQRSLTRPLRLLAFHPIIQAQSLLSAFNYGILYLMLSSFSDIWTTQYGESVAISGLHYITICVGEIVGVLVTGHIMDASFRWLKSRAHGADQPEYRMPLVIPSVILMPVGLLMYGWAAQANTFWLVIDVGAAVLAFGMTFAGQAFQAYVIDTYADHTSSASAASQFLRSLTAFGFPLFAPAMYNALGYGWGNTLLAFLTLIIMIPAPLLIWFYGPGLRQGARSSY
jgi:MFS family permease